MQTQRERLVADIAQRIRNELDPGNILELTVNSVRDFIDADRVIIIRSLHHHEWGGYRKNRVLPTTRLCWAGNYATHGCVGEKLPGALSAKAGGWP